MDDATLAALRAALDASPENRELRMVLVKALLERGDDDGAHALVEHFEPSGLPEAEHRILAARAALAAGEPQEALRFVADMEEPPALVLRARIRLALGDREAARSDYQAAVRASPALEDALLKRQLDSKVRVFAPREDGRPLLRVISNDDTDESEVSRLLVPDTEPVRFDDVGGLDAIKGQIRKRIILPFQKPSLFQRFKKRVGGGILLYGPPGCGKTLLARATAGECSATFFNVAISDVLDMYIGESERKLHALFEKARESVPAVLFFDEIEALGGKRQYTREATSSKLVSQFLSEMDGFSRNNQGVLILAATNVPWAVDPAFRRPGRFDRLLFVPPPDKPARAAILRLQLAERPFAADVDPEALAKATSGFSGADLRNLIETAADGAIEASIESGREEPIGSAHLAAALQEVKPTTLEWLTTARNYARYANEGGQYDEVLDFLRRHGRE